MTPGALVLMRLSEDSRTYAARVLSVSPGRELVLVEVWSERRGVFLAPEWRSRARICGELPGDDRRRAVLERVLVDRPGLSARDQTSRAWWSRVRAATARDLYRMCLDGEFGSPRSVRRVASLARVAPYTVIEELRRCGETRRTPNGPKVRR